MWYDSCGKKGYRKTYKKCDFDNLLLENEEEESDDELLDDNPGVSAGRKGIKEKNAFLSGGGGVGKSHLIKSTRLL